MEKATMPNDTSDKSGTTLIELAPRFEAMLQPGGHIVLAGLLNDQAAAIVDAYRPWVELQIANTVDGWTLLTGRRAAGT